MDHTKICCSCGQRHDIDDGVDLDGRFRWNMCNQCWGTVKPFERALLQLLATPVADGGCCPRPDVEIDS